MWMSLNQNKRPVCITEFVMPSSYVTEMQLSKHSGGLSIFMEGETLVVNKSRENIVWHPRFRVKVKSP
jgi:hypothetical protein